MDRGHLYHCSYVGSHQSVLQTVCHSLLKNPLGIHAQFVDILVSQRYSYKSNMCSIDNMRHNWGWWVGNLYL